MTPIDSLRPLANGELFQGAKVLGPLFFTFDLPLTQGHFQTFYGVQARQDMRSGFLGRTLQKPPSMNRKR
jgi:hypothetical protein